MGDETVILVITEANVELWSSAEKYFSTINKQSELYYGYSTESNISEVLGHDSGQILKQLIVSVILCMCVCVCVGLGRLCVVPTTLVRV